MSWSGCSTPLLEIGLVSIDIMLLSIRNFQSCGYIVLAGHQETPDVSGCKPVAKL